MSDGGGFPCGDCAGPSSLLDVWGSGRGALRFNTTALIIRIGFL